MTTPAATGALMMAAFFSICAICDAVTHNPGGMLAGCFVSGLFLEIARQLNKFGL